MSRIKILQLNMSMSYGGVTNYIYSLYENINHLEYSFDFLSTNTSTFNIHRKSIESYNDHMYGLGCNINKIFGKLIYLRKLKKFIKKSKYDIIHINSGSIIFNYAVAKLCKRNSESKIIIHSHSIVSTKNIIKKAIYFGLSKRINKYSDALFACSSLAGEKMFSGSEFVMIPNGINVNKFNYNNSNPDLIREKYNLSNDITIIGFVGRLVDIKNPFFALKVFEKYNKINKNSKLFFVGDGPLREPLDCLINSLGLENSVVITGLVDNVEDYVALFDVLLLPSIKEGFGYVAVEAQALGTYVLASDAIPRETRLTEIIDYKNLDADCWCSLLNEEINVYRNLKIDSVKYNDIIKKSQFNIVNSSRIVCEYYSRLINKE